MSDLHIIDSNSESNSTVFNIEVPSDLFFDVQNIALLYGSDIKTEIVEMLKCYVIAYQHLMGVKSYER